MLKPSTDYFIFWVIAPTYLSDRIFMNFDVNGYDIFEIVFFFFNVLYDMCS